MNSHSILRLLNGPSIIRRTWYVQDNSSSPEHDEYQHRTSLRYCSLEPLEIENYSLVQIRVCNCVLRSITLVGIWVGDSIFGGVTFVRVWISDSVFRRVPFVGVGISDGILSCITTYEWIFPHCQLRYLQSLEEGELLRGAAHTVVQSRLMM